MLNDDLALAAQVPQLQGLLPYLEAEVSRMKAAIVTRARTAASQAVLSPELSQALWFEYLAADGLLRKLGQRTRGAQGAGQRVADLLTAGQLGE